MTTGAIQLNEIVEALRQLGGTAQAKLIKDRVTELRGGMPAHYGRSHSYRETIQKQIEDHCPQSANWKPTNEPLFERIDRGIYRLISVAGTVQLEVADEALAAQVKADLDALLDEEVGVEGGKKERFVTTFERNPALRAAAIAFHGTTCKACGFSFKLAYGEHGKDYIEVHHIIPVSSLIEPSSISPKTDMTVLCSNCHRMVHRKREVPLSLEELRSMLRKNAA